MPPETAERGETVDLVVVATWVVARAALAVALGLAAIEDLARRVIPDGCSIAVAASGAVAAAARAAAGEEAGALVADALAGALATLGVMLGAALASWRARGTPGVGGGDVKLLGAVGVWLGPAWGLAAVALSCGVALALWGAVRLARRALGVGAARGVAEGAGVPLAPGIAAATLGIVLLGLPW